MNKAYLIVSLFIIFSCKGDLVEKPVKLFPNGNVEEKHFVDADGVVRKEIQYFENGNIKIEGAYNSLGKREGKWNSYYDSGVEWSIGEYIDGLQQGYNRVNFPNGKIRYEGYWKNDKKIGIWKFYNEGGELVKSQDLSAQ